MNDIPQENGQETRGATQTYRSEPGGGPTNPKTLRFVTLFIFGLIAAMALLTGRREVARWYKASAGNAFEDARYEDVITAVDKALSWDPGNEMLIQLRSQARMKNNDFEGCLADCDELLAQAAKDEEENEQDYAPLASKASALQRLGRHEETLEIWSKIIAYRKREFELRDDHDSRYAYAMSLNNRAYMVAQAHTSAEDKEEAAKYDVVQALEQIELALEVRMVPDDPVMLDTLGYLLLLNGRAGEAVEKLQDAVGLTKREYNARRAKIKAAIKVAQKPSRYQMALKELDQQFSIILHHRGEAYDVIGESEKAARDISEAKRLGYDPEEGVW